MSNTYELKQEGSTLYVLNKNGTNAFTMQVQRGLNDNGERLTEEQCEGLATAIRYGLECFSPSGCRINFEPLINE